MWQKVMAIVKCKECGKEISSKASQCPNCGYDYNKSKMYKNIIIVSVIIIIIIITCSIIFQSTVTLQENGIYSNEYDENRSTFMTYEFSYGNVYRTTIGFGSEKNIGTYTINGKTINIKTNSETSTDDFYCKILSSKKIKCYCDDKRYGKCLNNEYTYIGKD